MKQNEDGADAGVDVDAIAKGNDVGEVVAESAQRSPGCAEAGGSAKRLTRELSVRNWRTRRDLAAPRAADGELATGLLARASMSGEVERRR